MRWDWPLERPSLECALPRFAYAAQRNLLLLRLLFGQPFFLAPALALVQRPMQFVAEVGCNVKREEAAD